MMESLLGQLKLTKVRPKELPKGLHVTQGLGDGNCYDCGTFCDCKCDCDNCRCCDN